MAAPRAQGIVEVAGSGWFTLGLEDGVERILSVKVEDPYGSASQRMPTRGGGFPHLAIDAPRWPDSRTSGDAERDDTVCVVEARCSHSAPAQPMRQGRRSVARRKKPTLEATLVRVWLPIRVVAVVGWPGWVWGVGCGCGWGVGGGG